MNTIRRRISSVFLPLTASPCTRRYLEEQDLPYTVFQPLYLYGENNGKDCEEWFMDRVLRCQPQRACVLASSHWAALRR